MPIVTLSLAVVGTQFPNRRGPGRRFEIELCTPGESIELVPEPKNPAVPYAIGVFSVRGFQLGYLAAERAPWTGTQLSRGHVVRGIFQEKTRIGAIIRVAFDGRVPELPHEKQVPPKVSYIDSEVEFDPDPDPDWPEGDWLT